jgi:ribonuclease Z
MTVPQLVEKMGFPEEVARLVGTKAHTSPAAFGRVLSMTKPRLGVGYHLFNDWDTSPEIREEVKTTYDGLFVLADDNMVFNVTEDYIKTRTMVAAEDTWPPESVAEAKQLDAVAGFPAKEWETEPETMSSWLREKQLDFDE